MLKLAHDVNLALEKLQLLTSLVFFDHLDGEDLASRLADTLLHDGETTTTEFLSNIIGLQELLLRGRGGDSNRRTRGGQNDGGGL